MPKKAQARPEIKRDRNGLTRCRVCGCTELDPCYPPCAWAGEDICDSCARVVEQMKEWREGARRVSLAALLREFDRQIGRPQVALTRKAI